MLSVIRVSFPGSYIVLCLYFGLDCIYIYCSFSNRIFFFRLSYDHSMLVLVASVV
jgi:hypothetical protein